VSDQPAGAGTGFARAFIAAAIFILPAVGLYIANPAPVGPVTAPPPVIATVAQPAEVLRSGIADWSSVPLPISLHPGDAVRTAAGGTGGANGVVVELADGSRLQLSPGAAAEVVSYNPSDRRLRVRLLGGTVVVDTANPLLEIETTATIAALRPGSFRVVADGNDSTVTVYRGTVAGRLGDTEVPIGEGEEVRLSAGQSQAIRWQRDPAPTPVPVPTRAPTPTPMPTAAPSQRVHIVEEGDTLLYLAAKYRTTADAIQRLNSLADQNTLMIGQKLLIPPATP
jgi:hypothetical protein